MTLFVDTSVWSLALRPDQIDATELRIACRRKGLELGPIDAQSATTRPDFLR
jgi:hypothetical protein